MGFCAVLGEARRDVVARSFFQRWGPLESWQDGAHENGDNEKERGSYYSILALYNRLHRDNGKENGNYFIGKTAGV